MKEALKLALEALETIVDAIYINSEQEADAVYKVNDAITAIKAALAQPAQQEPVAWYVERQHIGFRDHGLKYGPFWKLSEAEELTDPIHILKPLYTTPSQEQQSCDRRTWGKPWVSLTDDEIWKFWCSRPEVSEGEDDSMEAEFVTSVRAVLAAHGIKEKNT